MGNKSIIFDLEMLYMTLYRLCVVNCNLIVVLRDSIANHSTMSDFILIYDIKRMLNYILYLVLRV